MFKKFIAFLILSIGITAFAQIASADKLYFTTRLEGSIQRANLDGTNNENVVTNVGEGLAYIDFDTLEGKLYWADTAGSGILRSNLDGSFPETILTRSVSVEGIAIDSVNRKMYWIEGHKDIFRANLDGSDDELIFTDPDIRYQPEYIIVENQSQKIYWSAINRPANGIIQRANLDGTDPEIVVANTNLSPEGVAVDLAAGKVYWSTNVSNTFNGIWRANLDGSAVEQIVVLQAGINGASGFFALDLENQKIFYSTVRSAITRANLDGTGAEIILPNPVDEQLLIEDMKVLEFMITESSLNMILGKEFLRELSAEGGVAPYTWSVDENTLPPGISLTDDGALQGVPSQLGDFDVTLRVTDDSGDTAEKTITLSVVLVPSDPNLRVQKSGTLTVPGREVDYWILVENIGGEAIQDVEVVEMMYPPTYFEFLAASPAPSIVNDMIILWQLPGALLPGQSRVIKYTVRLNPTLPFDVQVAGPVFAGSRKDVEKAANNQWLDILKNGPCWKAKPECDSFISVCTHLFGGATCSMLSLCNACSPDKIYRECGIECGACDVFSSDWTADCQMTTGPKDPNEKVVLAKKYIQPDQTLVYPIHYENIGEIEALDVFITDVLDPNLDDSTLQLLSPGASYEESTRTIFWSLLDRNLQPAESDAVLFSIKPAANLPSGTEIRNSAEIQFEVFEILQTEDVVNIIDTTKPSCTIDSLPENSLPEFTLSWQGEDQVGEIDFYNIFVSVDNSGFEPLLEDTKDMNFIFNGEIGSTYEFLCVAKDTAGNTEDQELIAEASTLIVDEQEENKSTLCSELDPNRRFVPDIDIFTFNGVQGEEVEVILFPDPNGESVGEQAKLFLKDRIFRLRFLKSDKGDLPNTIRAELPKAGKYTIIIKQNSPRRDPNRFRGDYCISLESSENAAQTLKSTAWVE